MRTAVVYYRDQKAGVLAQSPRGYSFRYIGEYLKDRDAPPISLTIPKKGVTFRSATMFAFFFGLLTEGVQKANQCRWMHLDEKDYMSRLMLTSENGAAGAVTVRRRQR